MVPYQDFLWDKVKHDIIPAQILVTAPSFGRYDRRVWIWRLLFALPKTIFLYFEQPD